MSVMSMPTGSFSRPCSRSSSRMWAARRSGTPVWSGIAPRIGETPPRKFSGGSQGAYIWWCLAAEPKSQRIGGPVRGSSAKRAFLSRAHSPMWVDVT